MKWRVSGAGAGVQVERVQHRPTGRPDRPEQLQVLEQHIAVVATGVQDQRAAQPEGAGEVAAADPVEQCPGGVEAGVPGQRVEVVLGADQVGRLQQPGQPGQVGGQLGPGRVAVPPQREHVGRLQLGHASRPVRPRTGQGG